MPYHVQKGDTIAKVTDAMNISWKSLRHLNPHAVGQSSRTGNWFLKEGAILKGKESFDSLLNQKMASNEQSLRTRNLERSKRSVDYVIKPGDTLWFLAVKRFHVNVKDLMKDNGIVDPRKLLPGQTIRVRLPTYPKKQEVIASWYGQIHHGRPMANGEIYNMYADTIAHKDLPLGTKVELQNPLTKQLVKAVVTDRGPYIAGRDVDLSYGLAMKLSLMEKGVGKLVMRVMEHKP